MKNKILFFPSKSRKLFHEAVADDDRSKNVVVCGLPEEGSEDLHSKITVLFNDVDEKPNFEAIRIGEVAEEKSTEQTSQDISSKL